MTDERERPGTSGDSAGAGGRGADEPTLAALFGFDPADERADDVSDADAAALRHLFADAADDEPAGGPTPLGVIAAATRSDRAQAERVERGRAQRRGRVFKGVLIAAAVAAVVVVVPVALRGGSSNTAGTAVDALATAAATSAAATSEAASAPAAAEAATSAAAGSAGSGFDTDSQAGGSPEAGSKSGAGAPEATATSAATSAAESSAAQSAAAGSVSIAVPTAQTRAPESAESDAAGGESASSTSASASGGLAAGSCVWPELKPAAAAAALRALGLPADTDVEPTTGPCVTGRVGAMYIPIVQVTVWVRHGGDLETSTAVDSATARATGHGLTVAVSKPSSTNFEGPMPANLPVTAQAVLDALT
jgi:hypothetical protein